MKRIVAMDIFTNILVTVCSAKQCSCWQFFLNLIPSRNQTCSCYSRWPWTNCRPPKMSGQDELIAMRNRLTVKCRAIKEVSAKIRTETLHKIRSRKTPCCPRYIHLKNITLPRKSLMIFSDFKFAIWEKEENETYLIDWKIQLILLN